MKVIGVTGGIGAGKSTIIQMAKENFPVAVILTDDVAKKQMEPGGCSYTEVVKTFGSEILDEDGWINRNRLAAIVFLDHDKLKQLNQITHPNVWDETITRIQDFRNDPRIMAVLVETALLFDAGFDRMCDETWYIDASESTRRRRLMASRGYTKEKVDEIFQRQHFIEQAKEKSDYVIMNEDGMEQHMIIQQMRDRIVNSTPTIVRNILD